MPESMPISPPPGSESSPTTESLAPRYSRATYANASSTFSIPPWFQYEYTVSQFLRILRLPSGHKLEERGSNLQEAQVTNELVLLLAAAEFGEDGLHRGAVPLSFRLARVSSQMIPQTSSTSAPVPTQTRTSSGSCRQLHATTPPGRNRREASQKTRRRRPVPLVQPPCRIRYPGR